jgi:hypothetical protein
VYVTFADLLDHALAYLGGDAGVKNSAVARRAVLAAYQDLPTRHPWKYYQTLGRVVTSAYYNTGTVAFDLTGGSSERLVTLSGGTFPSWAASGTLVVGSVPYDVDERLSGTTLTLVSTQAPSADVAAGTTYTLYRDTYPAPADLLTGYEMALDVVGQRLLYRQPTEWAQLRRRVVGPARPQFFVLTGDGAAAGGYAFRFWPPPDQEYAVDLLYRRRARAMALDRKEEGTVSVTQGSATVTGSNTLFTAAMVGSVMRLSSDARSAPTGDGGNNRAAFEGVVSAYTSATSLTLSAAADQTLSGVKYVVSDPADVLPDTHLRFLYREVERQCRVMARMKELPEEQREYQAALAEARQADSLYAGRRAAGGDTLPAFRLRDYPVGTEFNT